MSAGDLARDAQISRQPCSTLFGAQPCCPHALLLHRSAPPACPVTQPIITSLLHPACARTVACHSTAPTTRSALLALRRCWLGRSGVLPHRSVPWTTVHGTISYPPGWHLFSSAPGAQVPSRRVARPRCAELCVRCAALSSSLSSAQLVMRFDVLRCSMLRGAA